ncbi:hypothetical protein MSG28_002872 [Choristoneura fumiferana]|uniref:Uncharacterized protein n=1 Tax=Choristoneura fumiferana TaxID=7141 RepID=A0ACC0JJM5_CHOFU|nr:hypothetical protein MSG28_002872 [Choristoneura fumiferana]
MEIRRWQIYIVFNCVLLTHLAAKSVSLNELIAAESKQNQEKIQRPKSTDRRQDDNERIPMASEVALPRLVHLLAHGNTAQP